MFFFNKHITQSLVCIVMGLTVSLPGVAAETIADSLTVPLTRSSALTPGSAVSPQPITAQTVAKAISAVDPTLATNPAGSGFPGLRGGQQLVLYTPRYGQPTTGTNEFGFEVTVVNGRVVEQEGANSAIPLTGDPMTNFVVSGHGRSRDWLITHAPVGALLTRSGNTLVSQVSPETYVYQLQQRLSQVQDRVPVKARQQATNILTTLRLRMAASPQDAQVVALAQNALSELDEAVWQAMPRFAPQAIKGAWHRPVETSQETIGHRLDTLKKAGFNTVFLETFYHGYTIFPSETYRAYGLPTPYPKMAGLDFDPLKAWTEQAHKRGMQLHVWFQTFYGGTKAFQAPGPILSKYPGWANVQRVALGQPGPTPSNVETGHYFLDPANAEVTAFLKTLLVEIATRYPVDGIQLDYIRYASSFPIHRYSYLKTTWGYTPVARQLFKAQYGVDPAELTPDQTDLWTQWMNQKTAWVSQFVEQASQSIRQAKPGIKVSAAVFPNIEDSLIKKHQDWATWGKNGWVDFLAPMTLTSAVKVVNADTKRMVELTEGRIPVVSGLFGAFNGNTASLLLDQVYQAHQAGAAGICVFDTAHLTAEQLKAFQLAMQKKDIKSSLVQHTR